MGAFDSMPGAFGGVLYKPCRNYIEHQTCNWMIPADSGDRLCFSCGLNDVIPDISDPRRLSLWYEVEKAKRRLLYSLMALGLPIRRKSDTADGLAFRFLADDRLELDRATLWVDNAVATGHERGFITINILEADPSMREAMRKAMGERYRTVLGHCRHEAGHYYWSLLVGGPQIDAFRELFGDERADYQDAIDQYYRTGPPDTWSEGFVTRYASSHPLEDFAEVWAHYLHMMDTLETAEDARIAIDGRIVTSPKTVDGQFTLLDDVDEVESQFTRTLDGWVALATTLNVLNRSMGFADAYPFTLQPKVVAKLRFVHQLVEQSARN